MAKYQIIVLLFMGLIFTACGYSCDGFDDSNERDGFEDSTERKR